MWAVQGISPQRWVEWSWLSLGTDTSTTGLFLVYLFCFPVFWASGKSFAAAWDVWVDSRKAWLRYRFQAMKKRDLATLHELTP